MFEHKVLFWFLQLDYQIVLAQKLVLLSVSQMLESAHQKVMLFQRENYQRKLLFVQKMVKNQN